MLIVYYGCTVCTCMGGCVSALKVNICMSTGKKTHLKRKSSSEAASQLQRRLHGSVVLSWMPSRGMTQIWEGSESQLFYGFCLEASNRHPDIQRSNCWCVSDGLWTCLPEVHCRNLKYRENKASTNQMLVPNTKLSWQKKQVQFWGIKEEHWWEASEESHPCHCLEEIKLCVWEILAALYLPVEGR